MDDTAVRAATGMRFTVAICTWNRASLLARTLERLAQACPPAAPWELIVVDNGSTDDTAAILDRFARCLPLRVVGEPELGLSSARNAAVAEARGDYILWTDDDVLVDEHWLLAYESAVARWPDAVVFGGPIRPVFEAPSPAWLFDIWKDVGDAFAVRDLGTEPVALDGQRKIPYGANYAVRTREQRCVPYDPALGRKGRAGRLGEETALIQTLLRGGAAGWWVPGAVVNHWVPRSRQRISYLRSYFALVGRTFGGPPDGSCRRASLIRELLRAEFAYRVARLSGDPRRWLRPMIDASTLWGRLRRAAR